MKKIILGLSGIILLTLVVVLVSGAKGDPKETKKAATEVSKDCGKCPASAKCTDKSETKKCCDTKTADSKPCSASCKESCKANGDAKKCDNAKPCCASKK